MTLQHELDRVLPELRRQAESRMTSRATVRRKTGGTTTNEDGFQVPAWDVKHTDLRCFVDSAGPGSSGTRNVTVGSVEVQMALRMVKVPALTTDLLDGDLIEVTSGSCEGRVFQILEATPADHKKQQELPVVETSRPEEWA